MVKEIWMKPIGGATPIQRWNNKMRNMRTFLRGWARHTTGMLKKEKARLSAIIDELEEIAESQPLSTQDIELKNQSIARIAQLLREEELKWYQRSKKAQFILEGLLDTFITSPMEDIERNLFIHFIKKRG